MKFEYFDPNLLGGDPQKKNVTIGFLFIDNSKIKVRAQKGSKCFVEMKNRKNTF